MTVVAIPFLLCLILVCIHSYFGNFILKRGILFADLALAQWAALGYLIGHYFHLDSQLLLFFCGVSMSLLASLILSVLSPIFEKSKDQEAIIGILYVLASAGAIALISSSGMEGHHLQEMFSGHLLFVSKTELLYVTVLYSIIAALSFKFHHHFESHNSLSCFIFYGLFGVLVSSSVKLVGLLLVFSFLVIPVFVSRLRYETFKPQLLFSWFIGGIASLFGLFGSLVIDIPPAYCIILALGVCWGMSLLLYSIKTDK